MSTAATLLTHVSATVVRLQRSYDERGRCYGLGTIRLNRTCFSVQHCFYAMFMLRRDATVAQKQTVQKRSGTDACASSGRDVMC